MKLGFACQLFDVREEVVGYGQVGSISCHTGHGDRRAGNWSNRSSSVEVWSIRFTAWLDFFGSRYLLVVSYFTGD